MVAKLLHTHLLLSSANVPCSYAGIIYSICTVQHRKMSQSYLLLIHLTVYSVHWDPVSVHRHIDQVVVWIMCFIISAKPHVRYLPRMDSGTKIITAAHQNYISFKRIYYPLMIRMSVSEQGKTHESSSLSGLGPLWCPDGSPWIYQVAIFHCDD